MVRSSRLDNFIDKTFTIVANLVLQATPARKDSKIAFAFYRDRIAAQGDGAYSTSLMYYVKALRSETDPFNRSYILYNIRLIHASNGNDSKALAYYFSALDRNPTITQSLNNVAVLYHYRGEEALKNGEQEIAKLLFSRASEYWKEATRLAPENYIEAQNWLLTKTSIYIIFYL